MTIPFIIGGLLYILVMALAGLVIITILDTLYGDV